METKCSVDCGFADTAHSCGCLTKFLRKILEEMLVTTYKATQHHSSGDNNPYSQRRENCKPRKVLIFFLQGAAIKQIIL
jgi:hypothetical protein